MAEGGVAPPSEAVRKGMSRSLFAVVVIVVAVVAFVGGLGLGNVLYGQKPAKTTLVVGTNVPFPPFEDFNTTTGTFVGFDMDISALIATELNRTLVVSQFSDFQALLATVGLGGVDMAASSITMSGTAGAKRNDTMSFSNPYYNANQGVLVTTSSTLTCASNVCTAASLANLKVGVQQGTTSESWLADNKDPTTTVTPFTTVDTELAALKAGTINAVLIDYGPAQSFAASAGSGLKVAGQVITGELYGFAVPKGDPDGIVPAINRVIARIQANGVYDQLIAKWFV